MIYLCPYFPHFLIVFVDLWHFWHLVLGQCVKIQEMFDLIKHSLKILPFDYNTFHAIFVFMQCKKLKFTIHRTRNRRIFQIKHKNMCYDDDDDVLMYCTKTHTIARETHTFMLHRVAHNNNRPIIAELEFPSIISSVQFWHRNA